MINYQLSIFIDTKFGKLSELRIFQVINVRFLLLSINKNDKSNQKKS
jgi:hypothetical protein